MAKKCFVEKRQLLINRSFNISKGTICLECATIRIQKLNTVDESDKLSEISRSVIAKTND